MLSVSAEWLSWIVWSATHSWSSVGRQNDYLWKLGVSEHTTWYTSPVSMILQWELASGWGLKKWRSLPICGLIVHHRGRTSLPKVVGEEHQIFWSAVSLFDHCLSIHPLSINIHFAWCNIFLLSGGIRMKPCTSIHYMSRHCREKVWKLGAEWVIV